MHTSVGLLALAGFVFAPTQASQPLWMSDYGAAQKKGLAQQKPLAVIIGSGQDGLDKFLNEGELRGEARSTLASNYVCVYLDATRSENQRLVKAFDVRSGVGVIISDRSGEYQAFYHDGALAEGELLRQLQRHGTVETAVVQTSAPTTSTYQPVQRATYYSEPGRTVQQSIYQPTFYQPFTPSRSVQNC